jgi:hypothetical protein
MTMFASLVTIAILIASIYAGYRFSMYLHACGALGANARRMSTFERESVSPRRKRDSSLVQVSDYGLRYARTGILIFAILVSAILMIVVALISSVV